MKIYDKKLAYPYFVWMVLFTVVPLFIVVYYAMTDAEGNFTLNNLTSISGYGSVFARSYRPWPLYHAQYLRRGGAGHGV